jgi:division protein CdvB (Snf7/Vps24/ESCRT-III family)
LLQDLLREWDSEEKKPFFTRLKGKLLKSRPLRERIVYCIYRLKVQRDKLEIVVLKVKRRDSEIFGRCVDAQTRKDDARASIYASECHEIRKIFKIIFHCKLTIDQVILRLETIEIFANIAGSMVIPVNLVREMKNKLSGLLPSISSHLGEIASELEDIVLTAGEAETKTIDVSSLTEEAKTILEEAQLLVEEKIKDILPDLPEESTLELELS